MNIYMDKRLFIYIYIYRNIYIHGQERKYVGLRAQGLGLRVGDVDVDICMYIRVSFTNIRIYIQNIGCRVLCMCSVFGVQGSGQDLYCTHMQPRLGFRDQGSGLILTYDQLCICKYLYMYMSYIYTIVLCFLGLFALGFAF